MNVLVCPVVLTVSAPMKLKLPPSFTSSIPFV
jgi:hypothetical protein